MTIYISITQESHEWTLRVDGWLEDDEADELLRVVGSAPVPVVLDLAELRSADERGVTTLLQLEEQGVEITGISDYLRLLMDRTRGEKGTSPRER